MLGTMLHGDVELTILERVDGRIYPCRVRDPREWSAALDAAERISPGALGGILEWACPRCGAHCHADLATVAPVSFSRPELHWCEPSGLRRLMALLSTGDAAARVVVPVLPSLPSPH